MALTQDFRSIAVTSPLGKDVLLFSRMQGREALGRLFEYELEVFSRNPDIKADALLGQPVTIEMTRSDGGIRHFNGFTARFSHIGMEGDLTRYCLLLRPWLWFLTRTTDCRIFQHKKAPDIIKRIFKELGFGDVKDSLTGAYRERDYCVQYRESDFNFVSRLMEEEGIHYFFRHESGRHVLVLADSQGAYSKIPGYDSIPYFPQDNEARRNRDHLFVWSFTRKVKSGAYVLRDFDFETPRADLEIKSVCAKPHPKSDYECFDYPGGYIKPDEGQSYVDNRLAEFQAQHEVFHGEGNVAGLGAGDLFKLTGHPRQDQNIEYLVTDNHFEMASNEYGPATAVGGFEGYRCALGGLPKSQTFRPARLTRKPFVQGPQTAIVVGKQGEEIWTDKYGRVKVKFHWDRSDERDETCSCWIRVAHPWAGKNWGMVSLPRIGQEVIVSFLEGDPDRPIITGSVYNAEQMPPYALPGNATQSGIQSRSSKNGTSESFNEFRFEDKQGEEEVYLHAEKDFNMVVENDSKTQIGFDKKSPGDQTTKIFNNRTTTLDQGSDSLTIKMGDQTTKVDLGKISTEALQSIELKVGQSSLLIDQTGITLKGMIIKIEGVTMAELKSVMTTVSGDATLTTKGGIIMIN